MNFYPLLLQSISTSKNATLYLMSNVPWIIVIFLTILGRELWWNDFFALMKANLTATQINGEAVKLLIEQIKHIGRQIVVFLPLWVLVWRLCVPMSIRAIEHRPLKIYPQKAWYILVFDLMKLVLIWILYSIEKNTIINHPLFSAFLLVIGIFFFSVLYYVQTAFFIEKPSDNIQTFFAAWYHHLPEVLFLHVLDVGVGMISFCILGLILACFTYLPFIIFVLFALVLSFCLGKLWLIRKTLWIYSVSTMLKLVSL